MLSEKYRPDQSEESRRIIAQAHKREIWRQELVDKYGDDLIDYSDAYTNRVEGAPDWVELRGQTIEIEFVIESMGNMLLAQLEDQPEARRGGWLIDFFKDIEGLRRS